jgi:hypothetical protein
VGYTRQWTDKWRSTVNYGHANVDTENSNGPFACDHGNYLSANLIYQWSPTFRRVSNTSTEPTKSVTKYLTMASG